MEHPQRAGRPVIEGELEPPILRHPDLMIDVDDLVIGEIVDGDRVLDLRKSPLRREETDRQLVRSIGAVFAKLSRYIRMIPIEGLRLEDEVVVPGLGERRPADDADVPTFLGRYPPAALDIVMIVDFMTDRIAVDPPSSR